MPKQKGFAPIIFLLGILVVLGIVGGAYYLGTKKPASVVPTNNSVVNSQVQQIAPSPIDETANWQTYNNSTFNYTLKYPVGWKIAEDTNGNLPGTFWLSDGDPNANPNDPQEGNILITIGGVSSGSYDSHFVKAGTVIKGAAETTTTLSTFLVNGYSAVQEVTETTPGTTPYEYGVNTYIKGPKNDISISGFAKKGSYRKVSQEFIKTYLSMYKQILSTFKFTDYVGTELSPDDQAALKQAVSDAEKQPISALNITFSSNNKYPGLFASGQVGPAGGGGGSIWLAAKQNGKWIVFAETQGPVSCDILSKYKVPLDFVGPTCIDASGRLVNR